LGEARTDEGIHADDPREQIRLNQQIKSIECLAQRWPDTKATAAGFLLHQLT